jgi:hypothetical protein
METKTYKVRELSESVKSWPDNEIIEILNQINNTGKYDKNGATYALENELKKEWKRRGKGMLPKVMSDKQMIVTSK